LHNNLAASCFISWSPDEAAMLLLIQNFEVEGGDVIKSVNKFEKTPIVVLDILTFDTTPN
jgi:hypothetical protein